MTHGEVHIFPREIDALVVRRYAEIDLGTEFGEPAQTIDKPLRREIRRDADGQKAGALPPQETLGTERDLVERLADHREILAASLGDHESLALAIEQFEPKFGFKCPDLLADRTWGYEQFLGGAAYLVQSENSPMRVRVGARKRVIAAFRSYRFPNAAARNDRLRLALSRA